MLRLTSNAHNSMDGAGAPSRCLQEINAALYQQWACIELFKMTTQASLGLMKDDDSSVGEGEP
jgi:hypothetical protein